MQSMDIINSSKPLFSETNIGNTDIDYDMLGTMRDCKVLCKGLYEGLHEGLY